MDGRVLKFIRFYGWTRLVRHWSAMRWDDTMGLKPASLEMRPRGMFGQLERTKTSGPGKRVLVLPIFVSLRAYVRCSDWLRTGFELLGSDFSFDRDYLLPLASENLDGCFQRRAEYTGAIGYSRALLGTLAVSGLPASALVCPEAERFWTEHSDRTGLDSWHACLGRPRPSGRS